MEYQVQGSIMSFDPYENSKPLNEQQQNSNTVDMQKIEEPRPKPQIDQEEFVKGLVMKHLPAIKEFVRDLEPADRDFVYQLVEAKYPGYSYIAKMIIGNGNGNDNEKSYEEEEDDPEGGNDEPERPISQGIMQQAIQDAVTMYEAGMPPKEISEQIYSLYELDWSVQAIYRIVTRHQAFKQPATPKKEEPKVVIPKEPHRGIIRRIAHWLW